MTARLDREVYDAFWRAKAYDAYDESTRGATRVSEYYSETKEPYRGDSRGVKEEKRTYCALDAGPPLEGRRARGRRQRQDRLRIPLAFENG